MHSDRAAQTLENVNDALKAGRVASMPELLKVIQTIAQHESVMTVAELADLIKKDSAVLAKVIAAANSLGYNPTGAKISTVSGAIHLLGFNCVRRLAMSLLLMEHAGRSTTPAEQREVAAISLCSGMVAQVVAEQMSLIDPEEAFICAALRNFGRLVLGTIMTEDFREARRRTELDGNEDKAFRDVFGLTPAELGYELLRASNLPEPILNAIRAQPLVGTDPLNWTDSRLAVLATFALRLSELALDPHFDAARFEVTSRALMDRFASELPGLGDLAPDLLERTVQQLSKIARSAGGDSLDRYGLERLRRRNKGMALPPRVSVEPPAPPRSRAQTALESAPSLETACEQLVGVRTPDEAARIALSAMHRALALSDSLYCGCTYGREEFVLRHGHGGFACHLHGQTLFRRTERNIFLLCHGRRENVVVRDATEPTLQPHLPGWLREPGAPRSFVLLPVHQDGYVHGVILAGWAEAQPEQIPPDRLAMIRKLLALVARAFAGPGGPAAPGTAARAVGRAGTAR